MDRDTYCRRVVSFQRGVKNNSVTSQKKKNTSTQQHRIGAAISGVEYQTRKGTRKRLLGRVSCYNFDSKSLTDGRQIPTEEKDPASCDGGAAERWGWGLYYYTQDTYWCHTVSAFTAFSPNRIGECDSYYRVYWSTEVVQ